MVKTSEVVTTETGRYFIEDEYIYYQGDYNSFNLPDYEMLSLIALIFQDSFCIV